MKTPPISVGKTTVYGSGITVLAFAGAVVAFANGARDDVTFTTLGLGALTLLTVLGGRYGQAIAAVLGQAIGQMIARPAPTVTLSSLQPASPGVIGQIAAAANGDEDGPGDDLHPIFDDEPQTDPADLPPDMGEGEAAHVGTATLTASAASRASGPVSGLNASERAKAREMVIQAAYLGLRHAKAVHYTQGARRWEGIAKKYRAWRGQYPKYADCSSFATWVLWQGLGHFHVRDVVNGAGWLAGWTGTQLEHGKRVVHEKNIKHGDLALYNGHVAICVGGGMVISHGSEGGPYLLPLHYRSDLQEVRRYI